jgi:hypothetical protein
VEPLGQPQQALVISPISMSNCGTTTPYNYYAITDEREQNYNKNTRKIKEDGTHYQETVMIAGGMRCGSRL